MSPSYDPQADSQPVDQQQYQSIVGALNWIALATRPDICFATNMLAQAQASPTQNHLNAAKHVLRYLKDTASLGIHYTKVSSNNQADVTPCQVIAYADSSWGPAYLERHSLSGNIVMISGGPVTWAAKKQHAIALSSTEAEYVSLSLCVTKLIWIDELLNEIFHHQPDIVIMEDNQAAIALTHSNQHKKTKHIDIKIRHIIQTVTERNMKIIYCPTSQMVADIMTKPLPFTPFSNLRTRAAIN